MATRKPAAPKATAKKPAAKKPAKHEHVPTDETRRLVRELRAMGASNPYIGSRLGIGSHNTLSKHYAQELSEGLEAANLQMASALYKKGIKGDTICMIFWLKTRAQWREKSTDKDGEEAPQPVKVIVQVNDASVPRA